jgi:hypothetical protein
MIPKKLAHELRKIASRIDASQNPSREMVLRDLRKILVAAKRYDPFTAIGILQDWFPTDFDGSELELSRNAKWSPEGENERVVLTDIIPDATWRRIPNPFHGYDTGIPAIEVTIPNSPGGVPGMTVWFDTQSDSVDDPSSDWHKCQPGDFEDWDESNLGDDY